MTRIKFFLNYYWLILLLSIFFEANAKKPKLTLVIVIDQFCPYYLEKFKPFLKGGIGFLANNGIVYKNAFYPHCVPATAPGHTMLSTGTYARFHGIVGNKWYDKNNKRILSDQDDDPKAAVIKPDGSLYDFGRSAKNILVDGLSDQLIMHSYPHSTNAVWSISLKSRAAIATSTRLGKAIWFDELTGNFTSSKAYFEDLPQWLKNVNKKLNIYGANKIFWKTAYDNFNPYNYVFNNNFKFADRKQSMLCQLINIEELLKRNGDFAYIGTPNASQNLIEVAKACLDENLNKTDHLLLWLCLSSLDKLGHQVGQNAKDFIDLLYHIDKQIDDLLKHVYKKIDKDEVLIIMTADHGVQPISQLLSEMGLGLAKIYYAHELINNMNQIIEKKYRIKDIVKHFCETQFYIDQVKFDALTKQIQKNVMSDLKNYLLKLPGIKNVWTFDKLKDLICDPGNTDVYLKNQLFKGRSGQLIYSVFPYTLINAKKYGTAHSSQYAYDIQVPLIFYQSGILQQKNVYENVYITQVSVTLANILNVPRPSAAADNILPGIFPDQ